MERVRGLPACRGCSIPPVLDFLPFGNQRIEGAYMANLSGIVKQLKKERDRVESELTRLNAALAAFVGVYTSKPKRRKLSAK